MVFKIGTVSELDRLVLAVPQAVIVAMRNELVLLDYAYGAARNVDNGDGGFVLCCTPGTTLNELKGFFDPEGRVFEWVDCVDSEPAYCSVLYILSNDYAVEVFMAIADAPEYIAAELVEVKND